MDEDMKAAQAVVQHAEAAFEKEDLAAVVVGCDEALGVLNRFLEQYGK